MKHIFVVHSHITYIASLGVISKEGLLESDVLILSDGYQVNGPLPVHTTIINKNKIPKNKLLTRLSIIFNPAKFLYNLIEDFLCGDSFVAYIPVFHLLKKFVVIHPKCVGFHFIEEGLSSYYNCFSLSYYAMENPYPWMYNKGIKGLNERIRTAIRCLSVNKPKMEAIPLFYNSYTGDPDRHFYGLSDYSFPTSAQKTIVSIPLVLKAYPQLAEAMSINNGVIWIGDPDIEFIVGLDAYYSSLKSFLPKFLKKEDLLFVRFHYRESESQRKMFIDFLKQNEIQYSIIDDKQIMEFVFLSSHNCKVLGVNSSLLIYARILGHDSYTLINDFPTFRAEVDKQIPVFFKLVTAID